jgi:ankyrin repeat protein
MKNLILTFYSFLIIVSAANIKAQEVFHAIQEGNSQKLDSLLAEDRTIVDLADNDKDTPLHYAAYFGRGQIAEILISAGAKLNAQNYLGFTPLHYATNKGHTEVVKILITSGAEIDIKTLRGRTPLFLVAMNSGDPVIAKMLLDAGADVNTHENSGATPLSYAPFRGFNKLIDVLLDYEAEVETNTELWQEVFHRACLIGHVRLVTTMMEKGMDIHQRNEDGLLPLHSAAGGGSEYLVEYLAEQGNPVNAKDYNGTTPLHLASSSGHIHAVEKLLRLGADINDKNALGETPYNMAMLNGHHDVSAVLIKNGASQEPPKFPLIQGKYLGQESPKEKPEIFGPGLISSYAPVHGSVSFTPEGDEIYWSVVDFEKRGSSIFYMKMENNIWTKPEVPEFATEYSDDVPFISPDGQKLYFLSNRPAPDGNGQGKENIWVLDRQGDTWVNAQPLDSSINKMDLHWQFSVADDGTLYFASNDGGGFGLNDIYKSVCISGEYHAPQNLGGEVNTEFAEFAPYISPDQSFLIFSSRDRPEGSGLYISFRKDKGLWREAQYLDQPFGTNALLTTMSPDGKLLFFTGRNGGRKGVFWIDASIIEKLNKTINDRRN